MKSISRCVRLRAKASACLSITFAMALGCVSPSEPSEDQAAVLDQNAIASLIPSKIKEREAWAAAVVSALDENDKAPSAERVCAVLAIIEQESGYQVDPQIPNLPRIVRDGLKEKLAGLGPLTEPAVAALLAGRAPGGGQNFAQRVDKLRTERDLDRLFRDLASAYRGELPGTFVVASALSLLLGKGSLYDFNPVTTAGSMQVKVDFAREIKGVAPRQDAELREELYTREGGVRYGTVRLIGYPASYSDVVYRFADYNAGVYASRNAEFQARLVDLTGIKLALDGDLLAYGKDGEALDVDSKSLKTLLAFGREHGLSESTLRRDSKKEKQQEFEETESWKAVADAWESKTGKKLVYARVPDVAINSPKLSRTRSTAWFAESVKKRYQNCRARAVNKIVNV